MAHINYRRKNKPLCFPGWNLKRSGPWLKSQAWRETRRFVRECLHHERWDDIPSKYRHNLRYDFW